MESQHESPVGGPTPSCETIGKVAAGRRTVNLAFSKGLTRGKLTRFLWIDRPALKGILGLRFDLRSHICMERETEREKMKSPGN